MHLFDAEAGAAPFWKNTMAISYVMRHIYIVVLIKMTFLQVFYESVIPKSGHVINHS
jgi:hypothetical protein